VDVLQLTRKKTKIGGIVGLDIEADSIAAAEIRSNGSVQVSATAIQPLAAGAFQEGEVSDPDSVAEALKTLFAEHKLSKSVRIGIGNQRVVVRTLRLPAIEDPEELATAARFQAQEQIPMPFEQAVLAHQVVGGVPAKEDSPPMVDVVVVAARRDMIASFLEPVRRAGLDPVGIDLSAFGMIRALAGTEATTAVGGDGGPAGEPAAQPGHAILYCNVGDVMNLAVARGRACLFTRVSNEGLEGIAVRLAAEVGLSTAHAAQWLPHVGLERPVEEIEGDPQTVAGVRRVLEHGLTTLVDELRLSLDYYGAQETAVAVGQVVLCGPGSAIAGLAGRMEEGLGLPIGAARLPVLAEYGEEAAARLTLPYGLALES
jgi:type IV pilus assembly protein PilM